MYDTLDELLREIQAGEDSRIDFKEVVVKDRQVRFVRGEDKAANELAKDLTCFANTEGGVIVFGVRNDGERVGLPGEQAAALQDFIINVAQNNVEPPLGHMLTFDRVLLPDSRGEPKLCLKLDIKRTLVGVHAPKGRRPYWRLGDRCEEMTLEQQARAFERRGLMLPFEERPVPLAPPEALDRRRFESYCEVRYGEAGEREEADRLRLMQNLRVLRADESGALHPTALGLLLFCADVERWLSGAYVDVAVYATPQADADHQKDARRLSGTLIDQIEAALRYFQQSPYVPVRANKDGLGRIDRPAYSLRALQEGIVNALVHRDYSIAGAQVRVLLFPDRIEITNPGGLHNSLTPEDLFAGCQPVRRNQMLAGFLRDYTSPITRRAYMEARGEGFLTLVRECERVSGRKPELTRIGGGMKLVIYSGSPE